MSVMRRIAAFAAVAGIAALSGCGNRPDQGVVFKSVTQGWTKKNSQSGSLTPEQAGAAVTASLAQTDLPLALAVVEKTKATAILANIETNGGYRTWGTSDRRTVTTANGLVTATRGLGNDVMSSTIGGVVPLITGRKPGTGTHILRFLDGENHTVEVTADCRVTRGGTKRVSGGEIRDVPTTEMSEACTATDQSFTNSYFVDARGRVVQSRQWLGQANGYIVIQLLR